MKAGLISIHPKFCELIFNGKKTIEMRKTRPLIDMPFKVYVYETKARFVKCVHGACTKYEYGSGKVIGSFVCDDIISDWHGEYSYEFAKYALLSIDEQRKYGGNNLLYGWYITEPKLFDKPKELSKFCVPCKKYNDSELHCMEWDCEYYSFFPNANGDAEEECLCKGRKPLRRPPQSWCYIEGGNRE